MSECDEPPPEGPEGPDYYREAGLADDEVAAISHLIGDLYSGEWTIPYVAVLRADVTVVLRALDSFIETMFWMNVELARAARREPTDDEDGRGLTEKQARELFADLIDGAAARRALREGGTTIPVEQMRRAAGMPLHTTDSEDDRAGQPD
jgi:hypothetical protein